jgi:hypothetical protein
VFVGTIPTIHATDPAGRRNGAPDLPIVASSRVLAADALDRRRHDPASGRASTRRRRFFFVALRPNVDPAPSETTSLRKAARAVRFLT